MTRRVPNAEELRTKGGGAAGAVESLSARERQGAAFWYAKEGHVRLPVSRESTG